MRIGLIGINRYAKYLNFACNLHVYAFQQFLTQHGYDSTIIDYKPIYFDNFDMRNPAGYAEKKYLAAVGRKASTPSARESREKAIRKWAEFAVGFRSAEVERARRYDKFERFIADHLVFTEEKYDSDLLEVNDPGFDCYICVTDVIWQSVPGQGFDAGFFLASKAFEGKNKIAYAASRGASKDFVKDEEALFFEYLEDIDRISVRERDFQDYIESRSDLSAPTVLDPTLLHGRDFWEKVTTPPQLDRYLVLYYVMEQSTDTIAKAVEYAKLHDLTIVELSDRPLKHGKVTDPDVKHIARHDVGLEEWLGYIANAECVFTNSFHGCCFSLIYGTPMFVGRRNGQKVPNFLATFGLSDRQFAPDDDVTTFSSEVDWEAAHRQLEERSAESKAFILEALNAAQAETVDHDAATRRHHERRMQLTYPIHFHSGGAPADVHTASGISLKRLKSGATEYWEKGALYSNDGSTQIPGSRFKALDHRLDGWTLRFRIDHRWFWYLEDGSIALGKEAGPADGDRPKVFAPNDRIPHIPVNRIKMMVLTAQWKPNTQLLRAVRRRLGAVKRKIVG